MQGARAEGPSAAEMHVKPPFFSAKVGHQARITDPQSGGADGLRKAARQSLIICYYATFLGVIQWSSPETSPGQDPVSSACDGGEIIFEFLIRAG